MFNLFVNKVLYYINILMVSLIKQTAIKIKYINIFLRVFSQRFYKVNNLII